MQVLTGDQWVFVMKEASQASGTGWAAIPLCIGFFVFSNYFFVPLFIAVILENFGYTEAEKEAIQIAQEALVSG